MPKNIVICCDGTADEFGSRNSNVIKLYQTMVCDAAQIAYYHPGVGTMGARSALTRFGRWWTRLLGLAFGYGISENVADAYQFLMRVWRPGDRLYLIGFSRGAYTVRSLAGLLHLTGLLSEGNDALIPYAIRMARGRSIDFDVAAQFKGTFSRECTPWFIGVWDTVTSVGWIYNAVRFAFTKAAGNPDLRTVRQAIAIDERRAFFRHNMFGPSEHPGQDIMEVWLAGVHRDIGGSLPESEAALSQLTLRWMLDEAEHAGLRLDRQRKADILGGAPPHVPPDPATPIVHPSITGLWYLAELLPKVMYREDATGRWTRVIRPNLGRRRQIADGALVHVSVEQRMAAATVRYRPPNLPAIRTIVHDRPMNIGPE
ncbi:MAG TPA: DUF2235 domain-containing protein [Gemmatimonadales bacterium]|nr:DUF2235 domain-containing protein [Gemmatimonadales bacterium]